MTFNQFFCANSFWTSWLKLLIEQSFCWFVFVESILLFDFMCCMKIHLQKLCFVYLSITWMFDLMFWNFTLVASFKIQHTLSVPASASIPIDYTHGIQICEIYVIFNGIQPFSNFPYASTKSATRKWCIWKSLCRKLLCYAQHKYVQHSWIKSVPVKIWLNISC